MIPGSGQNAFVRIAVTQGARASAMEARYSNAADQAATFLLRAERDQAAD